MTKNSRKSADVVPKVYKNAQMWGGAPPPRAAGGESLRKAGVDAAGKRGYHSICYNCNLF